MTFSLDFNVVFNKKERLQKAKTIIRVLENACSPHILSNLACLEIGCSAGIMSEYFSSQFQKTFCIEIDDNALQHCRLIRKKNLVFLQNSGLQLAFKNDMFDVVICNHIYEHVPAADTLFQEIWRVVKPTGIVYVACTNKYWWFEPHYHLPFLSFLPQSLADRYLMFFTRKKKYDIQLRGYREIIKLFTGFEIKDITFDLISNMHDYELKLGWLNHIPSFLVKSLYCLIPNYIFILKKSSISMKRNMH